MSFFGINTLLASKRSPTTTTIVSGFPSGPNGVNWFGGNEGTFKSVDGVTATFYDPVTGGQNRWGQVVYKWTGGIVAGKSYEIKFTANLSLNNVWGPMYFAIGGPMLYLDWAVDKALLNWDGVFNNKSQWLQRGDPATPFPFGNNPYLYSYANTGGVPWTVKINGSGVAKFTNSITTGTWTFSIPQNVDLYVGFGNAWADTSQNSSVSNFSITQQS